nr:membrane protein b156 [Mastomys natalensis cytomegalovirus 3]WEG69972.1 membrane protein b156 [Mastomys natalensis cytomegalovirus 3]WEG70112.1 membrane protein b156 [Mastomys natalensis cytomegalovirus 3]WEG70252.1 membrane protein b156 [Mastomys natalensis cytomegalovirus 3]WEG70392.1 membrane protein b156 [Mastomys natalensis cytomegalovirus 3]
MRIMCTAIIYVGVFVTIIYAQTVVDNCSPLKLYFDITYSFEDKFRYHLMHENSMWIVNYDGIREVVNLELDNMTVEFGFLEKQRMLLKGLQNMFSDPYTCITAKHHCSIYSYQILCESTYYDDMYEPILIIVNNNINISDNYNKTYIQSLLFWGDGVEIIDDGVVDVYNRWNTICRILSSLDVEANYNISFVYHRSPTKIVSMCSLESRIPLYYTIRVGGPGLRAKKSIPISFYEGSDILTSFVRITVDTQYNVTSLWCTITSSFGFKKTLYSPLEVNYTIKSQYHHVNAFNITMEYEENRDDNCNNLQTFYIVEHNTLLTIVFFIFFFVLCIEFYTLLCNSENITIYEAIAILIAFVIQIMND